MFNLPLATSFATPTSLIIGFDTNEAIKNANIKQIATTPIDIATTIVVVVSAAELAFDVSSAAAPAAASNKLSMISEASEPTLAPSLI